MPAPKPNSGETRGEFIQRCVSVLVNEGADQEQAVAICSTQWDEKRAMQSNIDNKRKSFENNDIILK